MFLDIFKITIHHKCHDSRQTLAIREKKSQFEKENVAFCFC